MIAKPSISSAPAASDGLTQNATIVNERGLHARAAAKFVKLAGAFPADMRVTAKGFDVSALSIMGLLLLAASKGTTITISASGNQAKEALEALCGLIARGFDE
ncbi:MAG: HPr family phosphocarrier protein [Dongiaceae bacterium]